MSHRGDSNCRFHPRAKSAKVTVNTAAWSLLTDSRPPRLLYFVGGDLEVRQPRFSERRRHRTVGRIPAGGHQHAPDAPNIVSGVERPPTISQINFKPGAEVHRARGHDHPNIAQVSGCVTRRNVEGSAEGDGQVLKVAANSDSLGIDPQSGADWAGKLVAKSDLAVHPSTDGLNTLPPSGSIPK